MKRKGLNRLFFIFILSILWNFQTAFSQNNFRIYPYLQIHQQKVQIRWFSGQNLNSNLIVKDKIGNTVYSGTVVGVEVPEFYYTQAERNQTISGLTNGSWFGSDKYFKYEKVLTLPASQVFEYSVTLSGQSFSSEFKTPPSTEDWQSIRFIALSDSETEPPGRVTNRAWYPGKPLLRLLPVPSAWKSAFGTTTEEGVELPNYMLTEQKGFAENLKILKSRNPDFVLMPGDLVQGGAYMPSWDEFWRHTSGEFDQIFDKFPIIPAIGNWEAFGGVNGSYGFNEKGTFNPILGRSRFHLFFEFQTEDLDQKHRQSYYRTDYGPITILTLDTSNGTPDQKRSDFSDAQKVKNQQLTEIGTDTQENYTQAEYNAAGGSDLSGFGPGSPQYQWLENQLGLSESQGKIIFVQLHHIPYSSGEHGVPINHELATGQEGVAVRILNPLFEKYGVIAVFAGHDELFERSFVDEDGDGKGVHYYDVGVAGDGMRGVKRDWFVNPLQTLDYNSFSKWTADQNSIEIWDNSGVNPVLSDGGKHYGHLEVNLKKIQDGLKTYAQIDFEPVYSFPVMNAQYQLQRVERRVYADPVRILVELKSQLNPITPQFKNSIKVELDSQGKIETKNSDYLLNTFQSDWTVTFSRSPIFSCSDIGLREITLTIKNNQNQEWTGKVTVEVSDKLAPDFEATDAFLAFDKVVGKVTLNPESFFIRQEFITENCLNNGGVSIDFDRKELTCADLTGVPIPILITVTDRSGNATTKSRKVNLNPIESKKISISPVGNYLGQLGETLEIKLGEEFAYSVDAWLKDGQVISGQKDKKIEATQSGTYWARVIPNGGCIVETLKVSVSLLDRPYGPLKSTVELNLDSQGKATLSPSQLFVNWPLSDPNLVLSLSQTDFSCADIGEKEVTLTVKNQTGQTWTEKTKVTVLDKIAPDFEATDAFLAFDKVVGKVTLNPDSFSIRQEFITENCLNNGGVSIDFDRKELTCADLTGMPIPILITVTDRSGNATTKSRKVNLNPIESKKISISPAGNYLGQLGETLEIKLGEEFAYSVDAWLKDGQVISGQKDKKIEASQSGTYWARVIPNSGCIVETLKVSVSLLDKPYGPLKSTVELNLDSQGKATLSPSQLFVNWPLLDPNLILSLSQTEFSCADIGEKEVTLTVKNQTGQTWTEKTKVKVQDKEGPVLVTKTTSLVFDKVIGVLELRPEDFVSAVTDNCGIKSLELNKSNITCGDFDLPIELIITATDNSGNSTSKLITFIASPEESKKISIFPSGTYESVAGQSVELTLGNEFEYQVDLWLKNGQAIPVQKDKKLLVSESGTYWARVIPNGGCIVETHKVTVNFLEKPYGSLKSSLELNLNAEGKAGLSPSQVFVNWPLSDPSLTISLSQSEFSCQDLGEKEITVTIKNQTGQTWIEKTLVKVQDKEAPVLVSKNFTFDFDVQKGSAILKPEYFIASISDNCSVKEVSISKTTAVCEDVGKQIQVNIRAKDAMGNVSEASAILTIRRLETEPLTITGSSQFCSGEKGNLAISSSASFEVIRWRRNGVEIPGQTGKTLEVTESGKYQAVIRYIGGCLSESADFEVKVNPTPNGEIQVEGNILRAPEGNFTYQWFRNGEKITDANARILTVNSMGEFSVELTSASGCVARLKPVTLTISGLGGNWAKKPMNLNIYPNPASSKVTLQLPDDGFLEIPKIQIFNMEGKEVTAVVQKIKISDTEAELGISFLPSGLYLVRIQGALQNSYYGKFFILR